MQGWPARDKYINVINVRSLFNTWAAGDLAAQYQDAHAGLLNIGMLHTALAGREGHESYAPTTSEKLVIKGYHYWALGHVHNREVVRENPWIVFPGNTQGRHARELGEKAQRLIGHPDVPQTTKDKLSVQAKCSTRSSFKNRFSVN